MVSEKFRRQLRDEAQVWQTEELITSSQFEQFAQRYRFGELDTESRNRFVVILLSLGGVLLGLGVITFVAANWQVWPREVKFGLLLSVFLAVNAAGFYLWQSADRQAPTARSRFGHALLLFGAVTLGANLALMGQLFHQSGPAYGLFLFWGLGVWLMAFVLSLTSLGLFSIALLGVGYWMGYGELANIGVAPPWLWLIELMPLVASILFLSLAYRCQSRWIFGAGAIAILSSLAAVMIDLYWTLDAASGWVVALFLMLPPLLLWGYDSRLWQRLSRMSRPLTETELAFQPLAQNLALLVLAAQFYSLSYHWSWDDSLEAISLAQQWRLWSEAGWPFYLVLMILGFVLVAVLDWVYLSWSAQRRRWRLDQTSAVVLFLIVAQAAIAVWHWQVTPIQAVATLLFNVLLFLLAVGLMREGLGHGQRRAFWSGMLLLILQIVSRMLEYNTALVFKALVFVLCGVGVILVGLWFEYYVRRFGGIDHPALPSQEVN